MAFAERLAPPGKIKLNSRNLAEDWRKWKEEFSLYVSLTVKDEEASKLQLFKYLIGSDGREIYNTLKFEKEEKDRTLKMALEAFDKYCRPKKNETVERFRFNTRKQEAGETIETYITELKTLASTCNFGQVADSLIRDRIVCRIVNTHLRERLLRKLDLSLDKCVDMCRAAEITKQGISVLDGSSALTPAINKIIKQSTRKPDEKKQASEKQKYKQCKFCGKYHELKKEKCPAYGQTCRKCHKLNHFENKCSAYAKHWPTKITKKKVHAVDFGESSDSDDYYQSNSVTNSDEVGSVNSLNSKTAQATMLIQGKKVRFQLDTGATFTNPKNQMTQEADFVIIKDNCIPLLGNDKLQDKELLQWNSENILAISNYSPITKEQLLTEYKDVFEGIGRLEGDYHLVVDKSIPPVVHPPRRVPLALKAQLKDELDRLENLNIIAQVSEPTPWVSTCLMVVKPNKLRICIDPKDLNKALKRSYYPLPTIEEFLPQLTKAKVFSILDAKNGFWHVQMNHESSLLTTFNTPFGRYRWLRMPFCVSTAPEE
ncbi:uncharacterized protein K02A2.6-like [Saccostrea echinata]|uniref:uncharacterized protein K02A2.6-like n=1 Tax=Saccostrea echinata TaxID=191078 RepID=UPI002A82F0BC|nr:uncharacterized protein K02A2.6-like [Saccostrea echinata]